MDEYVDFSSKDIIAYATSLNWNLNTSKKGFQNPFERFGSSGLRTNHVKTNIHFLLDHKVPHGFNLLSKDHNYLLFPSNSICNTPLWFFDFNNEILPHAKLNAMFSKEFFDEINIKKLTLVDKLFSKFDSMIYSKTTIPLKIDTSKENSKSPYQTFTSYSSAVGNKAYEQIKLS